MVVCDGLLSCGKVMYKRGGAHLCWTESVMDGAREIKEVMDAEATEKEHEVGLVIRRSSVGNLRGVLC